MAGGARLALTQDKKSSRALEMVRSSSLSLLLVLLVLLSSVCFARAWSPSDYKEKEAKRGAYLAAAATCSQVKLKDWSCGSCSMVPGVSEAQVFKKDALLVRFVDFTTLFFMVF